MRERNNASAPEFRAFPAGGEHVQPLAAPGAPEHAAARSPEYPEAYPDFGPVQLKLVSHEPRGSGNPGNGRGRVRREGAAQSTYMRRGRADGCQEFPMRGEGGKFGQLRLANGEPREGSAPSPRPRPLRSRSASVSARLSVRGD